MTDIATIKAELLAAIACAQPDGSYADAEFDRIHAAIAALTPLTPTPDCLAAQAFVASPWRSLYSQFGPRHTAGKPTRHQTTMNLQSFNKFPAGRHVRFRISTRKSGWPMRITTMSSASRRSMARTGRR